MGVEAADQLVHLRLAAEVAGLDLPEIVLPSDHHVLLGAMRLHYLDWGGSGAPVVFLHGGGLTAHTWDLVCLALRDGHRCLALDQRGHGDSEWSPELDYGMDAHVRDLEAFIEELGLRRPLLVGQSMGGMNALAYAARHSGELAGVVVVDAGPDVRERGTQRILDFVLGPGELDSVDDFVQRALAFNPSRDERLLRRSLLHNLRRLPDGRWTWKYDRRWMSPEGFERLKSTLTSLRDKLPSIGCPVLVVRGARSDVFLDEDAASLAAALPTADWVRIEDAGHTVQGDNPRGLAVALRGFLASVAVGGRVG